jgi:hypothetical protein
MHELMMFECARARDYARGSLVIRAVDAYCGECLVYEDEVGIVFVRVLILSLLCHSKNL